MGRPFYPHEANDPDLDWLVSNFLGDRPLYLPVDLNMLPLVLVPYTEEPIVPEKTTPKKKPAKERATVPPPTPVPVQRK